MQFEYDGKKYFLEFQRTKKKIKLNRQGTIAEYTSKYPYTTARLLVASPEGTQILLTEHTVGCLPTDKFSNQAGRAAALSGLIELVADKGLRAAVWPAYTSRHTESVQEKIKALEAQLARLKKQL